MREPRASFTKVLALLFFALCLCAGAAGAESPCTLTAQGGEDSGIGGTGLSGEDSGIGGTGRGGDEDSGVGGTGVLGTITGFGSVCVNGLEIHYDADVAVTSNGTPASAADLAVGRVAWIVAFEQDDRLVAREVSLLSVLIGPVESIDAARRRITVSGETVEIPETALVFGHAGELQGLRIGMSVDVSGLRLADGRVVATRIDAAAPGRLRSKRLRVDTLVASAPALRWLSVESYLGHAADAGFRLGGIEVDARGVAPPRALAPDARVVVDGPLREGALRAERILVRDLGPDRPAPVPRPGGLPAPDNGKPPRPPKPSPAPRPVDRPDVVDRPERPDRPTVPDRPVVPERPELLDRSIVR